MKSKHIAKAIGVLSALADYHCDKDADIEGQSTEWHDLRSAVCHLQRALEDVASKEATNGTA